MRLPSAALALGMCAVALRDLPAVRLRRGVVVVEAAASPRGSDAPAEPTTVLAGRVVDEHGAGVVGARVECIAVRDGRSAPVATVRTDDQGAFEVHGLPRGVWWVRVEADGRARVLRAFTLREAWRTIAVALRPSATLDGVVMARRSDGTAPLVGVEVHASREGATAGEDPGIAALSGIDGRFSLAGLAAGTWRVTVRIPGFEPLDRIGVAAPARGLVLTARALASVHARVLDAAGEPAAGATVTVSGSGLWPAVERTTDAAGTVELSEVPAGVYELRARRGTWVAEPVAPLLIDPGEMREVGVALQEGRRIAGVVVDGASLRPLPGARVALSEDGVSAAPRAVEADAEGRFAFDGLLPRGHVLSARQPGYASADAVQALPGGGDLRVRLDRGASLVGRVVDARGRAVVGAAVELAVRDLDDRARWITAATQAFQEALFRAESGHGAPLVPRGELGVVPGRAPSIPTMPGVLAGPADAPGFRTGPDGRFEVADLPPGSVVATVTHPGFVRAVAAPVALVSGRAAEVAVVLHPGGSIDGRVLDDHQRPLAGVELELRGESDPLPQRAVSQRDGTFRFVGVWGSVSVGAWLAGRPAARRDVRVDDGALVPVTLMLAGELRTVTGRVLDARGFPVPGAVVTVTTLDAGAAGAVGATAATDGTFSAAVAGRGAVHVAVRHADYAPFDLDAAQVSAPVRVELSVGSTVRASVRDDGCASEALRGTLRTACGPAVFALRDGAALRLEHLCAGPAVLRVVAAGCVPYERAFTIVAAGNDLGTVELPAGGAVRGEVLDDRGDPVEGAAVSCGDGEDAAHATSDREGRFVLPTIPVGDRGVTATYRGRTVAAPVQVRVVRGSEVRGVRLRLEASLADVAERPVAVEAVALAHTPAGLVVRAVPPDGAAAAAGLQPGDRIVSVDGEAARSAAAVAAVLGGARRTVVVLEVERDGYRRVLRVAAYERR